MERHRLWLAFFTLLAVSTAAPSAEEQRRSPTSPRAGRPPSELMAVTGRVVQIHAPRLFTVRPRASHERELLVLSPRELSAEFSGATVTVEGVMRRFTDAELDRTAGWGEIDARTRERFSGRPVLVASSLMAIVGGEEVARVQPAPFRPEPAEPPPARDPQPPFVERGPRPVRPLAIRATMLADNIEEFAGRPLRVLHGRVVGVLEPHAFLIEPATPYLKAMGRRDRMLVLIESASLRAPAELLVGSIVTVTGVARTLVGVKVAGDATWPAQLRPEVVERLEVRGALLATSVQSGDGTELTDRRAPTPTR